VLVRDPKGRCEPQALLSTDLNLPARQIVVYFVRRSLDGDDLSGSPPLPGLGGSAPVE
jgi:hypothetical protein